MLTHIVCFSLREGFDWDHPTVQAAERISREHFRHIPEIVTWMVGRNTTLPRNSFDFAVVGQFVDRAALDRYMVHPDHQRGIDAWEPLSNWLVVDLDHEADAGVEATASAARPPLTAAAISIPSASR